MRVLVACEFSGVVRDAFIAKGHDAMSCDLIPTLTPGPHYCGDVQDVLQDGWDLMIAHPPCTYIAASGARWNKDPDRLQRQIEALEFVKTLLGAPISKICIENPLGVISTKIRKPTQKIQPWMFGEPESKLTCLWLKDLPILKGTQLAEPVFWREDGRPIWDNQTLTGTGQNRLGVGRANLRSMTYPGIAKAMADQWG